METFRAAMATAFSYLAICLIYAYMTWYQSSQGKQTEPKLYALLTGAYAVLVYLHFDELLG